ncbi:cytochrome-c peroxidase [Histidinibacterium aquaticum]|uniref:Cytochrome-c peroxidase n=1 Tax=Histidinibacterium aquaticum TaxID=2613962 RepID=A0A5J5GBX6_9RHOB|nr:cytochrome c peroxidase [Histidinibacterium aquaticum]KAA9005312.1 cytochrome-c peroxidase [Histidinibacterium aquaticum]
MRLTVFLFLSVSAPALADPLPAPLDAAEFPEAEMTEVELGQLLFYDPILSGSREVSCATCHHPNFATGDGVSLGIGDGGKGLGPERIANPDNPPEQRIPRNATALFNLGHDDIRVLFADGRIEEDPDRPAGFRTPLEDEMVAGFDGILSAQTMFPVLSPDEMAGHYQESEISLAVRQGRLTGEGGAWDLIAQRVAAIPAYQQAFEAAYPEIEAGADIAFTDISNAIAAFMAHEWRADDSPFDRHLRGEAPLTGEAARGMELFFGDAGCSECHAGPLLSDQEFHAMAVPQLGPGKAERFESHQRDIGRMRVTGRTEDAYAFRTPMLRNVVETGPWGHAGGHTDLRRFVLDHLDPAAALTTYSQEAKLPTLDGIKGDWTVMTSAEDRDAIAAAVGGDPVALGEQDIDALMAFLAALTDEASLSGRLGIPDAVPSGLPVER